MDIRLGRLWFAEDFARGRLLCCLRDAMGMRPSYVIFNIYETLTFHVSKVFFGSGQMASVAEEKMKFT